MVQETWKSFHFNHELVTLMALRVNALNNIS